MFEVISMSTFVAWYDLRVSVENYIYLVELTAMFLGRMHGHYSCQALSILTSVRELNKASVITWLSRTVPEGITSLLCQYLAYAHEGPCNN